MKSLRGFLLAWLVGGTTAVVAAAGAAVYVFVTRSLQTQFDANLDQRIDGFASLLFQTGEHVEFEFSEELMPEYASATDAAYFEIVFEDGTLLERSPSLDRDLLVPDATESAPSSWSAPLPDGRDGRFVARWIEVHHVSPEEGPDRPRAARLRIAVALGNERLLAAQRGVLLACAGVSLGLIGLIAVVAWLTVDRGLAPAKRLAAAIDAIHLDRAPSVFEVGELPAELQPVAAKTDALIRRLDKALERERRTTADIAHELRTPISEALTVAEVALRDRDDHEGARAALATLRNVAWRMGGSVSTLLKLARLEMGSESFEREPVDLGALVAEVLRSLAALERERALRVEVDVASDECVDGDREVLRIIVSNLLGNALYYSPRGSNVACRFTRDGNAWRFVVENDATDLREEDLRTLSEPFWRKDHSRTDRNRSGLGLALSRSLAEKTELHLAFELDHGRLRAALSGRAHAAPRHVSNNGETH